MAEEKEGEQNQPERPRTLENVLAAAFTLAISYVAARGVPSSNQSGDQAETNQQIADWTAAVARYTKRLAFWTGGLVVIGIITAATLALQTCTLINQLEESRTEQRAWIKVTSIRADKFLSTDNSLAFQGVSLVLKNVGKTPAKRVRFHLGLYPDLLTPMIKEQEEACAAGESSTTWVENRPIIFPDDEVTVGENPRKAILALGDLSRFKVPVRGADGKEHMIPGIVGCVLYETMNSTRRTWYAWEVGLPAPANQTPHHNLIEYPPPTELSGEQILWYQNGISRNDAE